MSISRIKHILKFGCLSGLLALWLPFHQTIDSLQVALIRISLIALVLVFWPEVVGSLVNHGWLHPMRRERALRYRWQFLGIVVVIECLVIKQLPELLGAVLRH